MTKKHLVLVVTSLVSLAACSPPDDPTPDGGTVVMSELGCEDASARLFDRLIDGDAADPERQPANLRRELLERLRQKMGNQPELERLDGLLQFLLEEAPGRLPTATTEARRDLFAALELELGDTPLEEELIGVYREKAAGVFEGLRTAGVACEAGLRQEARAGLPIPMPFQLAPADPLLGLRWTFSTAYQSCEVLSDPALTAADADVEGITINGTHPDGIGSRRFITDLPALQRSHPYLKRPVSTSCRDVRQSPLIYDYGGKPYAGTSTIDLHREAGDGTSVLGIDCSGFVSAALATSGLKAKSSVPLRPSQAGQYSSRSYLNPEDNGLNCLERIAVGNGTGLKDGDIVAVAGHVVMIDKAGDDPFGIRVATKVDDCERVELADFDFEIVQSSNSKNGVGLNRYRAADYLVTSAKMSTGLLKYAAQTCRNRFAGRTTVPRYSDIAVIRHRGTAACRAPRIPIEREACVESCFGGR